MTITIYLPARIHIGVLGAEASMPLDGNGKGKGFDAWQWIPRCSSISRFQRFTDVDSH